VNDTIFKAYDVLRLVTTCAVGIGFFDIRLMVSASAFTATLQPFLSLSSSTHVRVSVNARAGGAGVEANVASSSTKGS
jgi:tRNA G26 N,N-dimethylase Trm1